jgi:CDP-6-deoxy-D-xylo-4-hexulose-3-dehydrase
MEMKYCKRDFQIDGGKPIKMNTTRKHIRISVGEFRIDRAERNAINKVLDSGRISEGETVRKFEEEWAKYIGTTYAIALNSGTSALIAGLTALKYNRNGQKIRKNTKIITTPITYIATSNAIVLSGFEPVYVDVDKVTFCITPENIREHLEKVDNPEEYFLILPVHLMGYPCDMDEINRIAKEYGLLVFEDSAQAHGSLYKGKKVGSLSLLSDFSFYIAHNIQVGEMGTVTTNDYEITRVIKKIKANGRMCDCPICTRNTTGCPKMRWSENDFDPRFTHDIIGYNFKTMEFQVALGLTQLKKIDWIIERRRENVKYLNEGLEEFSSVIQLPKYDENVSYMAYPIVIKNPKKTGRKKMRMELEERGIETRPLFGCIPTQQPAYSYLKDKYERMLPVAEFVGSNGFYIGCHQYLTQKDLDYVVKAFGAVHDELLG